MSVNQRYLDFRLLSFYGAYFIKFLWGLLYEVFISSTLLNNISSYVS